MSIPDLDKWFAVVWAILAPVAIFIFSRYKRRETGRAMRDYQEKRMREINAQRIEEVKK